MRLHTNKKKGRSRQQLEQPGIQDDVIRYKDNLVLCFVFIGYVLGREKTCSILKNASCSLKTIFLFFKSI